MQRCSIAPFLHHQGLLQHVVDITMIAQFVAIYNSYCNTMKVRQNIVLLQPIHVLSQYKAICLQQCLCLVPHFEIVAICARILPQRFTLLHYLSLYRNKMTNSRNETYLLQYHCHITTVIQFVAIHDFYCNKTEYLERQN